MESNFSKVTLFWPVARGQSLNVLKSKFDNKKILIGEQTHSNKVAIVDDESDEVTPEVDGLVTKSKNLVLAVAVADCQIIFATDIKKQVIGIAHSGRAGTYSNIARELVKKMVELGANNDDIQIYISPSIGECHYEVDGSGDTNYYKQFLLKFGNKVAKKKPEGKFLNLREAQIQNLVAEGIRPDNIKVDDRCTHHAEDLFPSHRREGDRRTANLVGTMELA